MKLNKLDIAYGVLIFLSLIALIYLLIIRQPKIENVEVDVPVELGFGNYNLIYGGVAALSTFGLFSYFVRNNFIQNRFSKLIAIPAENAGSENYQTLIKKDANVINSDNLKWAFIVKLQNNFNYLKDKIYSTILYGYDKILFAYANNEVGNLILYGLTAVIAVLITLTSIVLVYRLLKYVSGKLSNKIKKLAEKSKKWYNSNKIENGKKVSLLPYTYILLRLEKIKVYLKECSVYLNESLLQKDNNFFKKYTEGEINYIIFFLRLIKDNNLMKGKIEMREENNKLKAEITFPPTMFTDTPKEISSDDIINEVIKCIEDLDNIISSDKIGNQIDSMNNQVKDTIYETEINNQKYKSLIKLPLDNWAYKNFLKNYFIKIKKYEALDKLYRKVPFLFEKPTELNSINLFSMLEQLNQTRDTIIKIECKNKLLKIQQKEYNTIEGYYYSVDVDFDKFYEFKTYDSNLYIEYIKLQISNLKLNNNDRGQTLFNYLLNSDEGRKELNAILLINSDEKWCLYSTYSLPFNTKDISNNFGLERKEGKIRVNSSLSNPFNSSKPYSDAYLDFSKLVEIDNYLNDKLKNIKPVITYGVQTKTKIETILNQNPNDINKFEESELENLVSVILKIIQQKIVILSDLDSLQNVMYDLFQEDSCYKNILDMLGFYNLNKQIY